MLKIIISLVSLTISTLLLLYIPYVDYIFILFNIIASSIILVMLTLLTFFTHLPPVRIAISKAAQQYQTLTSLDFGRMGMNVTLVILIYTYFHFIPLLYFVITTYLLAIAYLTLIYHYWRQSHDQL